MNATRRVPLLCVCCLIGSVLLIQSMARPQDPPCTVGVGELRDNCCWHITNARCYGPPHETGQHFKHHNDTSCTVTLHTAEGTNNETDFCSGNVRCPECRWETRAKGCRGDASMGICPTWVSNSTTLVHQRCPTVRYSAIRQCKHTVRCESCGHVIYDNDN